MKDLTKDVTYELRSDCQEGSRDKISLIEYSTQRNSKCNSSKVWMFQEEEEGQRTEHKEQGMEWEEARCKKSAEDGEASRDQIISP